MVVPSHKKTHVVGAYGVGHVVPVVYVTLKHRVVSHQYDGGIFACLFHFGCHPLYVLRHYMAISHTHQRA